MRTEYENIIVNKIFKIQSIREALIELKNIEVPDRQEGFKNFRQRRIQQGKRAVHIDFIMEELSRRNIQMAMRTLIIESMAMKDEGVRQIEI